MKGLSFIANCHGIFQLNIKSNVLSSAKLLVDHCCARSVQHCHALSIGIIGLQCIVFSRAIWITKAIQ